MKILKATAMLPRIMQICWIIEGLYSESNHDPHFFQQDGQVGSDQDDSNRSYLRKGVSSNSSSLSLSSVEEEFMQGLNFTNHHAEIGYFHFHLLWI